MAKLKAPLLSFGASGKIAGALVYFPWKGINAVREYVVPANPKSTLQIAQRTIFSTGVIVWHAAAYTDADRIAWNRYAGQLADIMSGFNAFMRIYIAQAIAALPWTGTSQVEVDTPTTAGFDIGIEKSQPGRYFTAVIGTSRTHFPTRVELVDETGGVYSYTWDAGQKNTDYYVKIEEMVGGDWRQRTGIYHIKTTG